MRTAIGFCAGLVLLAPPALWASVGGGDVAFKMNGAATVRFSHDVHVTQKKMKCSECHYALFTTRARHISFSMSDMQKGKSCGSCHNGGRAFDVKTNCQKCHV